MKTYQKCKEDYWKIPEQNCFSIFCSVIVYKHNIKEINTLIAEGDFIWSYDKHHNCAVENDVF